MIAKKIVRFLINALGYEVFPIPGLRGRITRQSRPFDLPDREYYSPLFSPWMGYGDFDKYYKSGEKFTLVDPVRCHVLLSLARQAAALRDTFVECGVYKGGTAMMLSRLILDNDLKTELHLFDTFAGMPESVPDADYHGKGCFSDVSFEEVRARINETCGGSAIVHFHRGYIPDTFHDCGIDRISFAHVDVDIYKSVLDCSDFIYPRLPAGGIVVYDDYGFPSCPGARKAVDEFFAEKPEVPLVLPTGQALVFKI